MSHGSYKISPVGRGRTRAALAFVAAGRGVGRDASHRAAMLRRMAASAVDGQAHLWWARRWGRCRAAALAAAYRGRTGMIYFSPADAPGVDRRALVAVLNATAAAAIRAAKLSLVQTLLAPDAHEDAAAVRDAGFQRLAELIYMEHPLVDDVDLDLPPGLAWRQYGQFSEAQLADIITRTYEQSDDCPKLRGRRSVPDVIAGHKAGGVFAPKLWWIVSRGDQPAGCVLVNASPDGQAADVAYLGVAAQCRGRGLGRALVRRALRDAYLEGYKTLSLAVDGSNTQAMCLYQQEGFFETGRRVAYVRFSGDSAPCPGAETRP